MALAADLTLEYAEYTALEMLQAGVPPLPLYNKEIQLIKVSSVLAR